MEGQTADGPDPLSHEAVVVLDVADHVTVGVVDGDELVHGSAGRVMRRRGGKTLSKTHLLLNVQGIFKDAKLQGKETMVLLV